MTDHDVEMNALRDELVDAGVIEVFTEDNGDEAYRLTEAGKRLGYQLSLLDDEGRDAVMEGLLGD